MNETEGTDMTESVSDLEHQIAAAINAAETYGVEFDDEGNVVTSAIAKTIMELIGPHLAAPAKTFENHHDDYECAEGEYCLGDLRYGQGWEDLPDDTKIEYELYRKGWWRRNPQRLGIIAGGRQNGRASLAFEVSKG